MPYMIMTVEQRLSVQHQICDYAKANDFDKVIEMLEMNNDDKNAVAEIITARPGGRTSIGQQAMWHNNIDAINKLKALDPIAFYNAWAVPLDLKIQAEKTLAEGWPTPRDPKWVDKKQEAKDILSKTKETVVDTVNEEHVTNATIDA